MCNCDTNSQNTLQITLHRLCCVWFHVWFCTMCKEQLTKEKVILKSENFDKFLFGCS